MKHFRLRTATLFIVVNLFAGSYAFASGAKRPDIEGDATVITENNGDTTNDNGSTNTPTTKPTTSNTGSGTTSLPSAAYNAPWKSSNSSIVIDAYQGNSIDWNKMATDKKVVGVIHRSSIGSTVDTQYKARKKIALENGYLWGAYHLGRPGNTNAQADLFIELLNNEPNTLGILDLENTTNGQFMTIDEAATFMQRVYEKTGRVLVVYANDSTTKLLNSKMKSNPLFQQSKLWYARFKSNISDFPAGLWKGYFLWQFASELNCSSTGSCLYNVPGTLFDMDVNVFYGSKSDLQAQWNNH
jgi:lysozyme